MAPGKGSRKQSRTPCWCGGPEAELTEVECSNCHSWVHYTCAGLLLPELCIVINTTDVLYLCKVCCSKPNVDKIRKELMETSDLSEIHNFDQRAFHHANLKLTDAVYYNNICQVAKDIREIKQSQESVADLVAVAIPMMQCPPSPRVPMATYAKVSGGSGHAPRSSENVKPPVQNQRTNKYVPRNPAPPRLVDPERSIVVDKVHDPNRFADSLALKDALVKADAQISVKISAAKVISSGRILIEATEKGTQQSLLDSLKGLPHDVFGQDASFRCMSDTPKSSEYDVVVRGISTAHSVDRLKDIVSEEYQRVKTIIDLSMPGGNPRFKSIKISLSDENEFNRMLKWGLRLGFQFFRAESWVRGPVQCFNCQNFGHVASVCRQNKRCVNCSETHEPDKNCAKEAKCEKPKSQKEAKKEA